MHATVTLDADGLVARLSDGRELRHADAVALADLLLAAGLSVDHVHMPDWREGDCAPMSGHKAAIRWRMRGGHRNDASLD